MIWRGVTAWCGCNRRIFRLSAPPSVCSAIADRRSAETASRDFATDASVRAVQPNFRYLLQDQKAAPAEGDPAQYANAILRLPQAHTLARGANVTIAVIDSGVDVKHPELANSIGDSFDALGSKEGPHVHGTGVAGAIAAHARLMGGAPEARILAIRAFGQATSGAESTTYVILKALDYAALHGAQIVNMSFAGPQDPLIERAIAAIAARGIVLVAAAGNAGPKSPPLYPAANPNVIAVSATDAQDKLFAASNRGSQIAIAAPGVDIFLPAPDEKYQMTSGHLVFRRLCQRPRGVGAGAQSCVEAGRGAHDPDRKPPAISARPAATICSVPGRPMPMRRSRRHRAGGAGSRSERPLLKKVRTEPQVPATRELQPAAAMASDRPAGDHAAAQ